jgi:hypothetical protein
MLYRLKAKVGQHVANGKVYSAGDVIESDKDLTKVFIGKFEVCHDGNAVDTGMSKPAIKSPSGVDGDKTKKSKSPSTSGKKADEDVTESYPTALDIGVTVHKKFKKNGEWFYVLDPDEDNAQLNKKMLREKNVEKFLASITED